MKKKIKRIQSNNKKKKKKIDASFVFSVAFFIVFGILIIGVVGILFNEINYKSESKNFQENLGELGTSGVFKVDNPNPSGNVVSFFVGENKSFSISNENYEHISWYVDNQNVENGTNSIQLKGLSKGNHTLEVRIDNSRAVDSKIWNIVIEDSDSSKEFAFGSGGIMFFVILVVIVMIILMLVWLVVQEGVNNHERKKLVIERESPVLDLTPSKKNRTSF